MKTGEHKELEKKATGDKREEAVVDGAAINEAMKDERKAVDPMQVAVDAKKACTEEVQVILSKYDCSLKAQITMNDERTISQVFIVNNPVIDEK